MGFKKFKDLASIDKIKADVKNTIDGKVNDAMGTFNSSDLNPDNIESKMNELEGKMAVFEDLGEKANTAMMGIEFMRDPKGAAIKYGTKFAKDAIENIPQVQELKEKATNEIKEKIMEIPKVKEFKTKAENFIKQNANIDIPSDLTSLSDNPEKLVNNMPSADALVEAAKRESGFARMLLRAGEKNMKIHG